MIYTVTLNPSIDYVVHMESLVAGITNRTTREEYYYGGKGINVSNGAGIRRRLYRRGN